MNTKLTRSTGIILGLFLIIYALNQFLHFFPTSLGEMPEFTQSYLDAIAPFLPALYIFEILIGILLIVNKWSPFVSIMMAPLTVNFLIFNITNLILNFPQNGLMNNIGMIWPAAIVAILNIILLYQYKDKYRPLFK